MEEGEPGGAGGDSDQGLEIPAAHAQGLVTADHQQCFASGSQVGSGFFGLVYGSGSGQGTKGKKEAQNIK